MTSGSSGALAIEASAPAAPRSRSRQLLIRLLALVSIGLLSSQPALGHDVQSDEAPPRPLWSGSWDPPKRNDRGWDWVRLSSEEWIKGEIVVMRDFELTFDSDEFDTVQVDWEDVIEIVTEHRYVVVLQDLKQSRTGTMTMKGGRVLVRSGKRVESFDRKEILAITPGGEREISLWNGHASAGLSLRSGNTDEAELSGRANLYREAKRTRFGFEYVGVYASLNDQKNTNNHRGRSVFDYFLTRDLFLTPASFEVFTDEFQNISYRITPTVGLGYYLIRRSAIEWQVRFGAGYQHIRFDSAVPGDSKTADNGAVLFGTTIDADLNSRIDLILNYQLQMVAPDSGKTNHHGEATLEIELTSIVDLDVSFVWDRVEDPEEDGNGRVPEADDFRLSVGLGVEF